jgi:hypothetical protein
VSGVFERQGDEWVEREPDYGHVPPTTFHEGTGELHSAFTGPPVSFIPLPGRIGLPLQPSGYQRWAGRAPTRPAAQRPAARVRPELATLAAPPPTPSAEQRAFEHFLANLTWQCERCSTPVTPDTMRVPEPVAGAFHLYCQGCAS